VPAPATSTIRRIDLSATGLPAPRPGGIKGREDDRSLALVQSRAAEGLAQRIQEIEARIAELNERGAEPAAGAEGFHATVIQPDHEIDSEIDVLLNQLRILRMQAALLPKGLRAGVSVAPRLCSQCATANGHRKS
jgi:hypothetical protein